jgi:transposase-like protein
LETEENKDARPGKGWRRHPLREEAERLLRERRGDAASVARELGIRPGTVRHWRWEMS